MRKMILTLAAFAAGFTFSVNAQDTFWAESTQNEASDQIIKPKSYRTVAMDLNQLSDFLRSAPNEKTVQPWNSSAIISLPTPEGGTAEFTFVESSIMEEGLQDKFPNIRTYLGQDKNDQSSSVRFDLTPQGFHAIVFRQSGTFFIDPLSVSAKDQCIVYTRAAFFATSTKVRDELDPIIGEEFQIDSDKFDELRGLPKTVNGKRVLKYGVQEEQEELPRMVVPSGGQLRTYRLAIAATGEYTAFHGGTVAQAQAAIVTSMNRVNGVYEREVQIRMVLVANNNLIVYTNGATDPYTNGNGGTMLNENQVNIDNVIGSANYDIGHVYSTGGGGIAQLFSPCSSNKARGVTGQGQPIGDPFDIDYVAHEMGHQFGGNHTQNNTCQRSTSAAYEPGSASTIMGYAGICPVNLQSNSDDYFHNHSYNEIKSFSVNGGGNGCATITNTGNGVPTIDAGPSGFTIPASTPFELTGIGNDPDGDDLTYTWEQYDLGPSTNSTAQFNNPTGNQPIFRTWTGTTNPTRVFPRIQDLVNNTTAVGEILPTYTRNLRFRCTVRDFRPGGGGVNDDEMTMSVSGTSGPFVVTYPNTNVSLAANSNVLVTWDVANTDVAPVNCTSVDIFLSYDGGFTYTETLATAAANNGSALVTLPFTQSGTARIKVKGRGNVFFDISNQNFTIGAPTGGADLDAQALSASVDVVGDCPSTATSADFSFANAGLDDITSLVINYNIDGGASQTINWNGNLSSGNTESVQLIFPNPSSGAHSLNVTIGNVNGVADDNPVNNGTTASFTTVAGDRQVSFSLTTDCYEGETSYSITSDDTGDVLASAAAGSLPGDYITTTESLCLTEGCYTVTIGDTYGDGLAGTEFACTQDGDYSVVQVDDGTVLVQMGAANFGFEAVENFCVTPQVVVSGCTDETACNYDPAANQEDGSCEIPTAGTIDIEGVNNVTACRGDGFAEPTTVNNSGFGPELTFVFTNASGIVVDLSTSSTIDLENVPLSAIGLWGVGHGTGNAPQLGDAIGDLTNNCQKLSGAINIFSGTSGCTDPTACNYDENADCDSGNCEYSSCLGCTNEIACNYDPASTVDDGSCILPDGCTDDTACNYDETALCDDGTCEFDSCGCNGDLNNDGFVNTTDLLALVSEIGCQSNCTVDLNNDELTNTIDLVQLVSLLGTVCP